MARTIRVNQDVFKLLDAWASPDMAFDWDRVGLQTGNRQNQINNILVTLDVTDAVIDEAIAKEANLIIAHHPIMFKPLDQIDTETPKGHMLQKLLKHNITVYAAHTNLDIAPGGVNDMMCEALGLKNVDILEETGKETLIKMVVYVPQTHAEQLRMSLGEAGGGFIGDYSHCTFNTDGVGTFKPTTDADPYIGVADEMSRVNETKIETIIPESSLQGLINRMKADHPYEEVAYDLYELANAGPANGIGRIGYLEEPMPLETLAAQVKKDLNVDGVRVVGDLSRIVKTVAILGGSGEKFISTAMQQEADVLITGDLTFHPSQDALEAGMSLIDPGHHAEKIMKQGVKDYLSNHISDDQIQIYQSVTDTEPFQFM